MYSDLTRNNTDRKALVKLRISNHKLNVEIGTYHDISEDERLCSVCGLNNIEHKIHFVLLS